MHPSSGGSSPARPLKPPTLSGMPGTCLLTAGLWRVRCNYDYLGAPHEHTVCRGFDDSDTIAVVAIFARSMLWLVLLIHKTTALTGKPHTDAN